MSRPLYLLLAYQQEAYIADAVRSALAQERPPLDILISDDCSTDDTYKIAEATVASYAGPHNVTLRRNARNLGLIDHINSRVDASQAEIIIYAGGDDISRPDRAQKLLAAFDDPAIQLAHSQVDLMDSSGALKDGWKTCTLHKPAAPIDAAGSVSLYVGATGAWHRSLFRKYGPLPEGVFEDLVLGFRAALEQASAFIDEPLVKYRADIGLSSTGASLNTKDAWATARKKRLTLYRTVFEARLADATTFGLGPSSDVSRRLRAQIADQSLRADLVNASLGKAVARAFSDGPQALARWQSERSRARRALRR